MKVPSETRGFKTWAETEIPKIESRRRLPGSGSGWRMHRTSFAYMNIHASPRLVFVNMKTKLKWCKGNNDTSPGRSLSRPHPETIPATASQPQAGPGSPSSLRQAAATCPPARLPRPRPGHTWLRPRGTCSRGHHWPCSFHRRLSRARTHHHVPRPLVLVAWGFLL